MELSKGASVAIIAVVVVVVGALGYYMFVKPKSTSVSEETRQKYMQMRQSGTMGSGGSRPAMGGSASMGSGRMGSGTMGSGGMGSGGQ